jgi:hypothetical protein
MTYTRPARALVLAAAAVLLLPHWFLYQSC